MNESDIIALYKAHGWNDEASIRGDIANGNWQSKVSGWTGSNSSSGGSSTDSGSSSGSGASLPAFTFDQAAAEKQAMEELRPYYEKLLTIYNGDINLAKKRMEEDYARGLRYKSDATKTGLGDIEATKAERDRKFAIALKDLDQEANARGLFNSGIKTTNKQNAGADEAYQKQLLANQARDLTTAEKQYVETAGVDRTRFLEDKGFAPVTDIAGFVSEPQKKAIELNQQYQTDVGNKVNNSMNKAITYYNAGNTPITTAAPQDWTKILNDSLKMNGLPTIS